jgi:hypothetical protein
VQGAGCRVQGAGCRVQGAGREIDAKSRTCGRRLQEAVGMRGAATLLLRRRTVNR